MEQRRQDRQPYADGEEHHPAIISRIDASTRVERLLGGSLYRIEAFHPRVGRLDGLRILHLSDLHFNGRTPAKHLAALAAALRKERFDLVALTGDVLDHGDDPWSAEERAFLKGLRAKHGKFAVLGNHDYGRVRQPERARHFLRLAGFAELTNKTVKVAGLRLVGLDDPLGGRPDAEAFPDVKKEEFVLLLVHSLDALNATTPKALDLVLWGHIHAGECRFLGLDSVDWMLLRGHFKNMNRHRGPAPWKFLTERTLSYINPGFHSTLHQFYGVPRFGTRREGVALLTLRKYP